MALRGRCTTAVAGVPLCSYVPGQIETNVAKIGHPRLALLYGFTRTSHLILSAPSMPLHHPLRAAEAEVARLNERVATLDGGGAGVSRGDMRVRA